MEYQFKQVVDSLRRQQKTIATMESCTGGSVVDHITNIKGASEVLKFSAVTYSNEYKIKMGVSSDIIDKYSVYSMEVAKEMSYHIALFTHASYGIGITGKMQCVDKENPYGEDNIVFISIYDRENDIYYEEKMEVDQDSRVENKNMIVKYIALKLEEII